MLQPTTAGEGRIDAGDWERRFYELALKVSGAVQARRWTRTVDGGFTLSVNLMDPKVLIGLFIGGVILLIVSAICGGNTNFEANVRVTAALMVLSPISALLSFTSGINLWLGGLISLAVSLYGLYLLYHALVNALKGKEGTAKVITIVLAALEGRPATIIATVATHTNDIQIVARADAGITAPTDLRDKRVGTREGTAAHFFLHGFLIKYGMSDVDVDLRFDSFEGVTAALIAGDLHAVSLRQPFTSQLAAALGDDFVLFEEHGLYDKTMNLCVRADSTTPDQETRRRLVDAFLDAERVVSADTSGRTRVEVSAALEKFPGAAVPDELYPN